MPTAAGTLIGLFVIFLTKKRQIKTQKNNVGEEKKNN